MKNVFTVTFICDAYSRALLFQKNITKHNSFNEKNFHDSDNKQTSVSWSECYKPQDFLLSPLFTFCISSFFLVHMNFFPLCLTNNINLKWNWVKWLYHGLSPLEKVLHLNGATLIWINTILEKYPLLILWNFFFYSPVKHKWLSSHQSDVYKPFCFVPRIITAVVR